jgi:hypothetical protein
VIEYNNHGTWTDIELVLDVSTLSTTVNIMELIMQKLNDYLWDNPAPAPASDNSDYESIGPAAGDEEQL